MHCPPLHNLRMFKQLCGDKPFPNVVLVTTKGDMIGETRTKLVENKLIEEDGSWGYMIKRGSRLIRHTGDKESAMHIIDSILRLPTKVVLDIQQEMINQGAKLSETGAGKELESALRKAREKHERQLKEIKEEFNQALANYDQEVAEELRTSAGSTVNNLLVEYTTVVDDTVVPDKHLYLESGEPGRQHEGSPPAVGN